MEISARDVKNSPSARLPFLGPADRGCLPLQRPPGSVGVTGAEGAVQCGVRVHLFILWGLR